MFRERIKEAYEALTPSFKRLGEFILSNELDVAFMTATELAQSLGVDAATVVRFSQALGYTGYRQLSHEVQTVVKADLTAAYAAFPEARNDADRLRSLLENERHNLEVAITQITGEAADMLDALARAKRVWVIGEGTGKCLAEMFADRLRIAGLEAYAAGADLSSGALVTWDVGGQDLVIGLGVSGTGLDTAGVLRLAKQKGATVGAVSVSAVSPPALVADHSLVCPSKSPVGLPSTAGLVTVLMVLWQALLARDGDRMEERLEAIREAYSQLLSVRSEQGAQTDTALAWKDF